MAKGVVYACSRCGKPIRPDPTKVGDGWHLDHNDNRTGYLGPAHDDCNERAGGLKAQRR